MNKQKTRLSWSHETRVRMYKELAKYFGPYKDWVGMAAPGKGKTGKRENYFYKLWLSDFANQLCLEQGVEDVDKSGAIEQQIAFAITTQDLKRLDNSHCQSMVENKNAAFDAGFLG